MTLQLSADQVWEAVEKELFAVLGMVNATGEARTVGIVYIVRDRKLYIASESDTWKVRHVAANPHVSLTIPIAKRIPLMPWIKIPQATISFSGTARVIPAAETPADIVRAIFRDARLPELMAASSRHRSHAAKRICHLRHRYPADADALPGESTRPRAGGLAGRNGFT
jgi:hypothetical protein